MFPKAARTQTHRLLDATVVVRVQDAIRAVRAVAGDEHTAEAVVLEAVAAARGLVAADGAALALRVPVELDTLAVGDAAAVLAVGRKRDGEEGGEDEGSDGELHVCGGGREGWDSQEDDRGGSWRLWLCRRQTVLNVDGGQRR